MPIQFAGDGVTLTADAEGAWSGPAVLLLHGGGQTRQSWGGTSQVLADAGFLALTVDQRLTELNYLNKLVISRRVRLDC